MIVPQRIIQCSVEVWQKTKDVRRTSQRLVLRGPGIEPGAPRFTDEMATENFTTKPTTLTHQKHNVYHKPLASAVLDFAWIKMARTQGHTRFSGSLVVAR